MNAHVYNLSNFDNDPSGTIRKQHRGNMSVRYSTGEAYVVITDEKSGTTKEVLLKGETYRRFLNYLKKNRVLDVIPETKSELENMTHILLSKSTPLTNSMETVSVHDILIEREYDDAEEKEGVATEKKVILKRISRKTLAEDVEVLDKRTNSSGVQNGVVDAESLLNYIINAPLDLDPVFSLNSNLRLLTDKDDNSTDVIRLELNTMDNPVSETRAEKFVDRLITGTGALELIGKIDDDIAALRTFSKINVTNIDASGATNVVSVSPTSNADTLSLVADEKEKITIGLDSENKIYVKHAKVDDASVSISYQVGKVMVIQSVKTDGYGHVIEITTKDVNPEIAELYYNKTEIASAYVNKTNVGTEIMAGGLHIKKNLIVDGTVTILGDLISSGTTENQNTKQLNVKDVIMDIGVGNDATYRYVGVKLIKGVSSASGTAAKDAFVIYDKTDGRFKFVHARTSARDPNSIYDIEMADIEANNIIGTASSANKLSQAIKLLFTGSVTGSVEFFGDEGSKEVTMTINPATSTSFGTVKVYNSMPDSAPTETASVFGAPFLYEMLNELDLNYALSSSVTLDSTTTVATSAAVNAAYQAFVDFRQKYDYQVYLQEQAAEAARKSTPQILGYYETTIQFDPTVTPTVKGIGYDERNYDKTVTAGTSFLEYWEGTMKFNVKDLGGGVALFNVMSRMTDLEKISMPKINKEAMEGFVFGTQFTFELREYDDATTSTYTVVETGSAYEMADKYAELDYIDGSGTSIIYKRKFTNAFSFEDIASNPVLINIEDLYDYGTGRKVTVTPNASTASVYAKSGSLTEIKSVSGPFFTDALTRDVETVLQVNSFEYSTGVGLNLAINTGQKVNTHAFTMDISDFNRAKGMVFATYFKITKKYSSTYRSTGLMEAYVAYSKSTSSTLWSAVSSSSGKYYMLKDTDLTKAQWNSLETDKWYLLVTFLGDENSAFQDATGIRGIYDINTYGTATKVLELKNTVMAYHAASTESINSYTFNMNVCGMDIQFASPIVAEWNTAKISKDTLTALNKTALFKTAVSTSGYVSDFSTTQVDQDKYYSIECVSKSSGGFKPDTIPYVTRTTFGSNASTSSGLYPENVAENGGFVYELMNDADSNIQLHVTQTSEALDSSVQPDTWLTSVGTVSVMKANYFSPVTNNTIIVSADNSHTDSNGVAKTTRYYYNASVLDATGKSGKWIYLDDYIDYTWMAPVANQTEINKYYGVPANGSLMKITSDENKGGLMTYYYRRNGAWVFLTSTGSSGLTRVTDYATKASIESNQSAAADYSVSIETTNNIIYIKIGGVWTDFGSLAGPWNVRGQADTYLQFTEKYIEPQVNYAVKTTSDTHWWVYDGTTGWTDKGAYVEYTQVSKLIPVILSTTVDTVDLEIKTNYTKPATGNLCKVDIDTDHSSNTTYYAYMNGAWSYKGLYADYVEPIQNKILSGTLVLEKGTLRHKMSVRYQFWVAEEE